MAIQVQITLDDDGKITVTGPIHDKIFMFGLLECAKEAVRETPPPQLQQPNIIVPDLKIFPGDNDRKKGGN